nr:TnsA endonuclease N-terminal domain-containing protein [Pseudoalteromonas sp. NEC-BIFX-2020_015]
MGQGEKHLYISKLFDSNVVEIKEQYPLDYVLTQEIADTLGVIHPRKYLTGELTVVTTDLLITYRDENGSEYRVAYAFKYSIGGRNQTRTNQKLEIAETYWKRFGVRSEQILRDDVSKDKAHNLINYIDKYDKNICINEINEFVTTLLDDVIKHPSHTLRESLSATSASLHIEPSYSMTLFANAIFKNALPIDLMQEIKLHKPIKLALISKWG